MSLLCGRLFQCPCSWDMSQNQNCVSRSFSISFSISFFSCESRPRNSIYLQSTSLTPKGRGTLVTPPRHSKGGSLSGSSGSSLYACKIPTRKRNSSAFARVSPGQILLPAENGMKRSSLTTLPSSLRKRSGLNLCPSSQWSSPCRRDL